MIDENKFKRLPKWAQEEITILQRKIILQEKKIDQLFGKEPSNITASVDNKEKNLVDDSIIKIKVPKGFFQFMLVKGEIRIFTTGAKIKITPQATNSIYLSLD